MPLCSSSLLWVASFCSVGFLFLTSFLASPCWTFRHRFFICLSLVLVARCILGPSLPLGFHFAVWVVLRSLGVLLCSFGLALFSFLDRKFLSPVSGFQLLVLGFSVGLPQVFLSCAIAFLSSSRMLLLGRGSLCALFFPPLYTFGDFVFFCLQLFFLFLYRFPVLFLVLPLSIWFRSCSSPASSSSSVP